MKNLVLTFISLSLLAFQCENPIELIRCDCENNAPVYAMIEDVRSSPNKRLIELYNYKGSPVYLVNGCTDCADAMSTVYDCGGNTVCLFGGIAGFNTCPDFATEAKRIRIILKD